MRQRWPRRTDEVGSADQLQTSNLELQTWVLIVTLQRFYRLSLALPVLVPGSLFFAFSIVPGLATWLAASTSSMVLGILVLSLLYGGIPYAALALWATWRFSGESEREIRRVVVALPLLIAILVLACFAFVAAINGALNRASILLTAGPVASIVLGYTYVGIVLVARRFVTLTQEP